jgi:hypothetical protein
VALAGRLGTGCAGSRVLLLGVGSGRNVGVLAGTGARVEVVEDDVERAAAATQRYAAKAHVRVTRATYAGPVPYAAGFVAALSTHALLHGTPTEIASAVAAVRTSLAPDAPFYATLGSQRDPRFGEGHRLGPDTFAPLDGSEAGIPHAYFDERTVRTVLSDFVIEELREANAGATVGSWAHTRAEAARIVHWYVKARRAQ